MVGASLAVVGLLVAPGASSFNPARQPQDRQ